MYKVYGFVIDGGDGSSSIEWYDGMPDEDALESSPYSECYFDGDGLTHRQTLTFDSKEEAIRAGIKTINSWGTNKYGYGVKE